MKLNKTNKGLFITGTDTDVGKTFITQKILMQLSAQSISCVAMKPVASGAIATSSGLRNDDALILQKASNIFVPYDLINPYCFEPAIAPHLAAQVSGVTIQTSVILDAFYELQRLADVVIVEGVGGWQVPLNTQITNLLSVASLAEQLNLPVVLVVGLRLGCINHALLTANAITNSQCTMAGWVANEIDDTFLSADDCISTLQNQIDKPLMANVAWHHKKNLSNKINYNVVFDLDQVLLH
ncbi:Dethiobiotin synthetase [hydrothermal vent metagenome]|uniref:Dethiobiotin synthetase n=1 Tax=hydrothermal vent metagenome TaxID=652676 RepID=A0A3B1A7A3_9ZZZZ